MVNNSFNRLRLHNVEVYLSEDVFSHEQLFVAFSRDISASTTKLLVKEDTLRQTIVTYTKNLVYKVLIL